MAKAKLKSVYLKQKRAHAHGFRLGKHVIMGGGAKLYKLNEKEVEELKGKGPQSWLQEVSKEDFKAIPKSNAENKKIQDAKKLAAEEEEAKKLDEEALEEEAELPAEEE